MGWASRVVGPDFTSSSCLLFYFIFNKMYLFLERGEGSDKERERNINVWLPLTCPLLGTFPATHACAPTANPTGDPLICRPALNPLSHTSQGKLLSFTSVTSLPCAFTYLLIEQAFECFLASQKVVEGNFVCKVA